MRGGGRGGGTGMGRGAERDTGEGLSSKNVTVPERLDDVFRELSTLIGDTC